MGDLENIKVLENSLQRFELIRQKVADADLSYLGDIEDLSIGVCITDNKGYYVAVNEAYCKLYGYPKEELVGNHFSIILPVSEELPQTLQYYENFVSQNIVDGQWKVQRKDGKEMLVLVKGLIVKDILENRFQISMVVKIDEFTSNETVFHQTIEQLNQHITALKDKLEAQDMAESLMVHDLKKPLRNILAMIDLIAAHDLSLEEIREWHQSMKKQTAKALQQLETLNGLKKMESGTYKLELKPLNIISLFEELEVELKPALESKKLQLKLVKADQQKSDYTLMADAIFIERLAYNLLINAIEASPEYEAITVNLHKNHQMVIKIHNQGTVPESVRTRFFEKYVSHGKKRGTGLGTYLAKLITDVHKGDIQMFTSESEGTVVTLKLPLASGG